MKIYTSTCMHIYTETCFGFYQGFLVSFYFRGGSKTLPRQLIHWEEHENKCCSTKERKFLIKHVEGEYWAYPTDYQANKVTNKDQVHNDYCLK